MKQRRFKISFFEMTVIFDKEKQKTTMTDHRMIYKTGRGKKKMTAKKFIM